ncbi:MAG: hypothetical protein BWY38_03161 [Ignavibacteria bacterium ADurb.Bin266]|nr:MAG: hypothetical protein BWY38_03161 [Ignavibacteria bacterium ADurb.Bin266]
MYHLVIIVICVLYLFFANTIALLFYNGSKVEKVNFDSLKSNSKAYVSVESSEHLGGMFEEEYFHGWAFCETKVDNTNKQINIIFKNNKTNKCYRVKSNAQFRPDVYGVFRKTTGIYNGMNGINCKFSTIGMEKGSYKVYIQVIENDTNYSVYDTGNELII